MRTNLLYLVSMRAAGAHKRKKREDERQNQSTEKHIIALKMCTIIVLPFLSTGVSAPPFVPLALSVMATVSVIAPASAIATISNIAPASIVATISAIVAISTIVTVSAIVTIVVMTTASAIAYRNYLCHCHYLRFIPKPMHTFTK